MTELEKFAAAVSILPEHSRIYARGVLDGLTARESDEQKKTSTEKSSDRDPVPMA